MTTQTKPILGFNGAYRFLSNFHPAVIEFEGLTYATVEHAYQAAKTESSLLREHLSVTGGISAGGAKHVGRGLAIRSDWNDVKVPIMRTLLRKKFYDSILKAALLQTSDAYLEETNYWHDNFWGHCTCIKHSNEPFTNWLGTLLMELRSDSNN